MKKGGFADSIERSSAKWKCASPQAQTDVNYTTPPAGEQERLERLEKKVGWFDPPKKLRRTVLKRSDEQSSQAEGVNQVSRKLNFNEESPQLSSYSLSPNTLISPFSRMKLSPEQNNNITRNNSNNYTQFSPSQQTMMPQQQGYGVVYQQQQQQQYIPVPLQAQYGQQPQIQQRGNIYQQEEYSSQLSTQQHRQNPISRTAFIVQPTTNNYRTNSNSNNNNNILKFR